MLFPVPEKPPNLASSLGLSSEDISFVKLCLILTVDEMSFLWVSVAFIRVFVFVFVLAAPMACGSSQTRDRTQATAVATLDL